ncbi:MAG: DUF92 domain-containing protein [archaeon]
MAYKKKKKKNLNEYLILLSRKKPLLITSLKEVETGTDGGISVLGSVSALIGAGLIAGMHYFLYKSVFFLQE